MSSLTPDITDLEVSRKTVRVADGLEIELRYKDFYIIRTGACDFTGLRVWPGAELLAKFLHAAGEGGLLTSDSCVCELGAGVGLSGLVAAKYAQHVVLTDRVPLLLQLMAENIALNDLCGRASVYSLDWSAEAARQMMEEYAESEKTIDGAAAAAAASAADPAPVPVLPRAPWAFTRACVVAADVVYPDTSDAALAALFATVDALLGPADAGADVATAASTAAASDVAPSSLARAFPAPRLTGCFVCSYFSRDARTTRRLLVAAHASGFEPTPIDQAAFDPEHQSTDDGLQGLILCFRRVARPTVVESITPESPDEALPAFMHHPALRRLWQPPPSSAERALDELNDVNEDNAFSRLALSDDDDDDDDDE